MGALFAALAFGTFWFWAILVVSAIIVTALVEHEEGFWALLTVAITVGIINKFSLPIVAFFLTSPKRAAIIIALYFVVGAIWGVVKWFFYVNRQLEMYNEVKAKVLKSNKAKEVTPETAKEIRDEVRRSYSDVKPEVNPQVSEHKSDIMRWMTYWPFSAFWTLINDPVRKIFRSIYARLAGSMQAISDRMFKNVNAELELADQVPEPDKKSRRGNFD